MFDKLEKYLSPVADALSKNKILSAIRDGFLITVPIVIVGWSEMVASVFGEGWEVYLDAVTSSTFDVVALTGVLSIGYCYAREKGVDKIAGGVVALTCFLIITPKTHIAYVNEAGKAFSGFSFGNLGTSGMFLSMITAILSVSIFAWAMRKKLVIKLPDGVPPAVMDSFAALIPAAFAMVTFFIVNIIFTNTAYGSAHAFIYEVLQAPLVGLGRSNLFEVIYQFLSTLFWFFGINGPAVTNTIFAPIHKVLTQENYEAAKAGIAMTNVFTSAFSDFFCNYGGGGSTLGLVILMAFTGKSNRIKTLGRLSLPAAIFGINEPIIFGLPIVLNPLMAVPFIFVPVLNTITATIATSIGILPITAGVQLPWTTPILFSGWLVTGSFVASLFQLAQLAMDMAIYFPFLKMLDRKYLEEEANTANESDELDDLSFDDLVLE